MGNCGSVHSDNEENIVQDSQFSPRDFVVLCEVPKLICFNPPMFLNDSGCDVFSGEFNNKTVAISRIEQLNTHIAENESALLRRLEHENVCNLILFWYLSCQNYKKILTGDSTVV